MDGGGIQFLDIVFFAMVAGFLILRLRSVLGRRTGEEKPERWRPRPPQSGPAPAADAGAARAPTQGAPAATPSADAVASPLDAGIAQIRGADPSFAPAGFLQGARSAFEMIVGAFAQGDTASLRPLLADEVNDNFAAAIRERLAKKHSHETVLIAIKSAELVDARMDGRDAVVTIKFVTEQVNVTRDAAGAVVEGDPNRVATATDLWTFRRNTRSGSPNWLLVETASPQ